MTPTSASSHTPRPGRRGQATLLGQDDIEEAATALEPGSSAGILVHENLWAVPFVTALRRGGAGMVVSGRIPLPAVLDALDAAEVAR
ncbi:hypothetical protein [Streptomyces incanus]|uniref:Uncharacterized protein n=1 Tax=Streptomyces incanus TaxID=887453 RepID=A0ABW0XX63_9ACTN